MTNPEQTLIFIQAGIEDLEKYLLSEVIYWPLGRRTDIPRLTIGSLLLAMIRLRAGAESTQNTFEVERFAGELGIIKTRWQSAWDKKAKQEARARMILWKNYLGDYFQEPEIQVEYYPREVKWRVLLQLLIEDSGSLQEEAGLLSELDKMVKSAWLPGEFLWEPYLVPAFQMPDYWFLYGRLK